MGKEKIRKQLTLFLRRVQKFYPQKVILCGSYAQKKANEYSDVDIVVVSDMFDGRFDELYNLTSDLYPDFQVYGVTSKEMSSMNKLTTLYHAISTGEVIL